MAFKSKGEKRAFRIGLLSGLKRKKKKQLKRSRKIKPGMYDPYVKQKNEKLEKKRQEFLKKGGARSGIFDISKPDTEKFVKEYQEFIPENEIYYRDSKGNLSPVFKNR